MAEDMDRGEALATLVEIGESLLSQGDLEGSLHAFDDALRLAPDSTPSLLGSAAALANLGQFDDAYRYVDLAIDIAPDDLATWRTASAVAIAAGDGEAAAEAAARRLELDGEDPEAHLDRGVAAFFLLDLDTAEDAVSAALKIDPDYTEARVWLERLRSIRTTHDLLVEVGRAYCRRGMFVRGLECFDRALDVGDSYEAHLFAGRALLELGEPDVAADEFEKALAIAPGDAPALIDFGEASARTGETTRVRWAGERLLERDPASEDARMLLEWAAELEAPQYGHHFCTRCGAHVRDGATYCMTCGMKVR